MNAAIGYAYYGTSDPMSEHEVYRFKKYWKQNRKKLIRSGRFWFDPDALKRLFHLDCFQCKAVHQATCCERGHPYAVSSRQVKPIEQYVTQMKPGFLLPEAEQTIKESGIWEMGRYDTIKKHEGDCLFATRLNGISCCAVHAHAAVYEDDVYPIKPFSCQLYPLEIIQMPDGILITALTEETAGFSRWGWDYLDYYYCANLERRKRAEQLDANVFSVDGYRPAYWWGMELLKRTFGPEVTEALERSVNK